MGAIPIGEPRPPGQRSARVVLLASGFRPFFLLASWGAALAMPVWLASWLGALDFDPPAGIVLWHGHEMVYGVAAAGMAGFILTAVPNWTGTRSLSGLRLGLLVALWVAGRAAMAELVPPPYGAPIDVAFLPVLAIAVGPAILHGSRARNGVFVLLLLVLCAGNGAFHANVAWFGASEALRAAIGMFALIIALVGGRIVPAFTQSGVRAAGRTVAIGPAPYLDRVAIIVLLAAVLADSGGIAATPCAILAGAAALLHGVRLFRWKGWRAIDLPLVWMLHAGYAWIVIGAALLAAKHLGVAHPSAALHAWGAGAVGTMLIAVMSRASLGHGGRDLVADATTVAAGTLVIVGATLRVVGALVDSSVHHLLLTAGGIAWCAGYLTFAVRYVPIWLRPRVDGKPG